MPQGFSPATQVAPARGLDSGVYRNAFVPDSLVDNFLSDPSLNCWDLYRRSLRDRGAAKPFLGLRPWQPMSKTLACRFEWLTYAQVGSYACRFAMALDSHETLPESSTTVLRFCSPRTMTNRNRGPRRPVVEGDVTFRFLGVFSKNRLEWFLAEQAVNLCGVTLVPLYETFGVDALRDILKLTEMNTLMVSWQCLSALIAVLRSENGSPLTCSIPGHRDGFQPRSSRQATLEKSAKRTGERRMSTTTSGEVSHLRSVIVLPPYPCLNPKHRRVPSGTSPSTPCVTCGRGGGAQWDDIRWDLESQTRTLEELGISCWLWDEFLDCAVQDKDGESCGDGTVSSHLSDGEFVRTNGRAKIYSLWGHDKDAMEAASFRADLLESVARPDTIQTVCFTSGTTGTPKGVMMSHKNVIAVVAAALRGPFASRLININDDDCHISYLPLAHIFERMVVNLAVVNGARVGIFSGDVRALLTDVTLLRPTVFVSVPRVFHRINDRMNAGLKRRSILSQLVFHLAYQTKLSNFRKDARNVTHPFWDRILFGHIRSLLGGRVRYLLVGGAPLEAAIQERLSIIFGVPFLQGYGLTEALGAVFSSLPSDFPGCVGTPLPSIEFKVRSLPSMGYWANTSEPGGPASDAGVVRGELLVRGPSVSLGYFRNPVESRNLFVSDDVYTQAADDSSSQESSYLSSQEQHSDSQTRAHESVASFSHANFARDESDWMRTGDIVEFDTVSGRISIIDRHKNMFKLAQGEYVVPEKLESVYRRAALVDQIFVHGLSTKAYLVAIVVPDAEAALAWYASAGHSGLVGSEAHCLELLCKAAAAASPPSAESTAATTSQMEGSDGGIGDLDRPARQESSHQSGLASPKAEAQVLGAQYKASVLAQLRYQAKIAGCQGFEYIRDVWLTPEAFTIENGCLSPTMKLKRHVIVETYKEELRAMFSALDEALTDSAWTPSAAFTDPKPTP